MKIVLAAVIVLTMGTALAQETQFFGVFPRSGYQFSEMCESPATKSEAGKRTAACMSFLAGLREGYSASQTITPECRAQVLEISPLDLWETLLPTRSDRVTPLSLQVGAAMKVLARACQ